jgi:hypothetical protein
MLQEYEMQYLIKYASIKCVTWWALEEWHEEHTCQVSWMYHAYKSIYEHILILILWFFFTLEEQESGRISYMKDAVPYEGIPTKVISYF